VTAQVEAARIMLLNADADSKQLYARWYHHESGTLQRWPGPDAYRAAMLCWQSFEPGWTVESPPNDTSFVQARRGEQQRGLLPTEYHCAEPGRLSVTPGTALKAVPLISQLLNGFWFLWGRGSQAALPVHRQRVYINLRPGYGLDWVSALSQLAPVEGNWSMKILSGTHDSGRRDASLLYLDKAEPIESGWVAALLAKAAAWCQDELPPMVKLLHTGIGQAPEPAEELSFGEAVCVLLADLKSVADQPGNFHEQACRSLAALGVDIKS
jgi:hypothetical protein